MKRTSPRLPSRRNVSAGPGAITSNTFWSSVELSIALKQARRVEYLGQRIHHATRLPALLGPFLTKTNTVGNRDEIKVTFSQNVLFVWSFLIVLDIFHKNRCLDSCHSLFFLFLSTTRDIPEFQDARNRDILSGFVLFLSRSLGTTTLVRKSLPRNAAWHDTQNDNCGSGYIYWSLCEALISADTRFGSWDSSSQLQLETRFGKKYLELV